MLIRAYELSSLGCRQGKLTCLKDLLIIVNHCYQLANKTETEIAFLKGIFTRIFSNKTAIKSKKLGGLVCLA